MKSEKKILVAFLLNLFFSIFELIGGLFTNSIAIISDSVHDIGDAASIGISYFLEKKSNKQPDDTYTYGYGRYSVLGGLITTGILLFGSMLVIYHAVLRIFKPVIIHYNGMIIFAIVGIVVNFMAAYLTREGDSFNQKAVNLHMLEDVLGWIVVLVGAIVIRFTSFTIIDPIMSIGVAIFILCCAIKNLKEILNLFLVKIPEGIKVDILKEKLLDLKCVQDIHHVHVWSIDGNHNYATMHVVTDGDFLEVKRHVKEHLKEYGIFHATLEMEKVGEYCGEKECHFMHEHKSGHHHHHHHHH